jgi:hypothetical protein
MLTWEEAEREGQTPRRPQPVPKRPGPPAGRGAAAEERSGGPESSDGAHAGRIQGEVLGGRAFGDASSGAASGRKRCRSVPAADPNFSPVSTANPPGKPQLMGSVELETGVAIIKYQGG